MSWFPVVGSVVEGLDGTGSSRSQLQPNPRSQHMVIAFSFGVCTAVVRGLSCPVSVTQVNELHYFTIIIFTSIS